MKNKKGVSKWVWAIGALVVIAILVGIYFLLASNGVGGIPQPPALPA
jgi:hypothetical protein